MINQSNRRMYNYEDVKAFVEEEDIMFIRLAFCDLYGRQKNISIMAHELERAFCEGISFDASAIDGFADASRSDLFLIPDAATLTVLPWRPQSGRVARMFCDIRYPDGTPYEKDTRHFLKQAIKEAGREGVVCDIGVEFEFYLFNTDENGRSTNVPFDQAGYLDIAPEDRGENVRREICFSLLDMGIVPESSHHEEGPGQNEIDFRYADPLTTADNAVTFRSVVRTIAKRNGLFADFSPKPLKNEPGNGMHINVSLKDRNYERSLMFMAGILEHMEEMTIFFNPSEASYERLGSCKAPRYISWSEENRSQLIRIPAADSIHKRIELRSPDGSSNTYMALALLIYAGLDGIRKGMKPQPSTDVNLYTADRTVTGSLKKIPESRSEAIRLASESAWLQTIIPKSFVEQYQYDEQ